jgi:hypothetical protein
MVCSGRGGEHASNPSEDRQWLDQMVRSLLGWSRFIGGDQLALLSSAMSFVS